jgi:hypothetical protein
MLNDKQGQVEWMCATLTGCEKGLTTGDYNQDRPDSALGQRSPKDFAALSEQKQLA